MRKETLFQQLKDYFNSLTPAQLLFKAVWSFQRFSFVSPKADKILSYLLTYVDYEDICKPITLSTSRMEEELNFKTATIYFALKELMLMGLITYVSGKYEKEKALEERKKVFKDTRKTRSYNEVNAYSLGSAIAYGVVCDFIHSQGVSYKTLTDISLMFTSQLPEYLNTSLSLNQLACLPVNEIRSLLSTNPTNYLLPAFTLATLTGISDSLNSPAIQDIAEELENLIIKSLCKSSSGDSHIRESDQGDSHIRESDQRDSLIRESDSHIRASDSHICDNPPNHIPPNEHTHTHTVEKNAHTPTGEPSQRRPVETSENQGDSPPEERGQEKKPSERQSQNLRLSEEVKEWFMDCLKRDGVRNPNALMRKMSDEEIRDTIKRHLDELIDNEEEYEFLKQRLPVEEIARYFLLSEEARIDFLKEKGLLTELQNYYLAKEYEELFRQVFLIIVSKGSKELAKKTLANFIRTRYNGRAKTIKTIVEMFLRKLKEMNIIWEEQANGSIKIRGNKESFDRELPNLIRSILQKSTPESPYL